jgi:hypothetical protein
MQSGWGWKSVAWAVLGAVVGALLESMVNGAAGRVLIQDGLIWGAAVAMFVMSIPNFARMGQMTVKSDKPAVNLAAGFALFVLISVLLVLIMMGILLGLGRLIGT